MLARYVKVSGDNGILVRGIPLAEASFFPSFCEDFLVDNLSLERAEMVVR